MPTGSPGFPSPRRLLIVEDDALVALGIRLTVQELGYTVVGVAATGEEAESLAGRHRPDLALMDVRLRGPLDGIETARRLRAAHGLRSIFLSAYTDETTLSRMAQTQPLGFVGKPYSAPQLKSALDLAYGRITLAPCAPS